MSKKFKTVAIVGRSSDDRIEEPVQALVAHLTKLGVDIIALPELAAKIGVAESPEDDIGDDADLIIAVGGDGTMLYAADLDGGRGKPLLGVNRGRLGFLADVRPDEIPICLDEVFAGNYTEQSRMLLVATASMPGGAVRYAHALNDVVVQRRETGRMIDLKTSVGGRYINTHAGDGLIVATPTGSTAYSLSCGGPIIEPGQDAVVLVPICPHTLSDRPIVVSASHEIEIRLLEREETKGEIIVDGRNIGELEPGEVLRVKSAGKRVTLIHPPGYDYYEILRSKLHWGRDSRHQQD